MTHVTAAYWPTVNSVPKSVNAKRADAVLFTMKPMAMGIAISPKDAPTRNAVADFSDSSRAYVPGKDIVKGNSVAELKPYKAVPMRRTFKEFPAPALTVNITSETTQPIILPVRILATPTHLMMPATRARPVAMPSQNMEADQATQCPLGPSGSMWCSATYEEIQPPYPSSNPKYRKKRRVSIPVGMMPSGCKASSMSESAE
mmetsp:Transcript_14686/g.21615  ORF Transcript_14686/g.21615 Transcript_14686/m.21615 type:complete len:202 (-) Transcript_14686:764-1369(-)